MKRMIRIHALVAPRRLRPVVRAMGVMRRFLAPLAEAFESDTGSASCPSSLPT